MFSALECRERDVVAERTRASCDTLSTVEIVLSPIRDAVYRDITALEDLQRRASLVWDEYRADLEAHPEVIEVPAWAVEAGYVRVAEGSVGLVGFSVLLPAAERAAELDGLFVDPAVFRRGVGRALIADALTRARDRGWPRIEVTANPRAVDFYAKVGFRDDGVVATRFGAGLRMHIDTLGGRRTDASG